MQRCLPHWASSTILASSMKALYRSSYLLALIISLARCLSLPCLVLIPSLGVRLIMLVILSIFLITRSLGVTATLLERTIILIRCQKVAIILSIRIPLAWILIFTLTISSVIRMSTSATQSVSMTFKCRSGGRPQHHPSPPTFLPPPR